MPEPPVVRVGAGGAELGALAGDVARSARAGRQVVGIAGPPGVGKSTVTGALAASLAAAGARCAVVPLDGFHLADRELARLGLLARKGAPETFDAWGYAEALRRVRARPAHRVYVPAFERDLEQPLAGAIPVPVEADVVLTEGNYLLLDLPGWRAARSSMDTVWFAATEPALRRARLVERHVAFGKSPEAAERWVETVDEPNARLVEASRSGADLVVELSAWAGPA